MAQSEQRMTSKRTVRRTGADGKMETVVITEEKRIVDGKEEVVKTTETVTNDDTGSAQRAIETEMADEWPKDFFNRQHKTEGCGDEASGPRKMFDNFFNKEDRRKFDDVPSFAARKACMANCDFKIYEMTSGTEKSSHKHKECKVVKPDVGEFRRQALTSHNSYRKKHGSPDVKLSKELNDLAQEWADHLARIGQLQHRPNSGYGENVYFGYKSNESVTANEAVDQWYGEIKDYNFTRHGFAGNTGHFTQVVWRSSKEIGIGVAVTDAGKTFVVANYSPPGNVVGQYEDNVKPAK